MKRIILSALVMLTTASLFCAASFGYNEDFSVAVKVPDTKSVKVTKPMKMDTKITALEFSQKMGNGINLGNTLEATRNQFGSTTL